MKRNNIILLVFFIVSLSINAQGFNSLSQEGVKGDVKSIKVICYNASEHNGSIYKNDIITTYDYDANIYPISRYDYNTDGNIVKFICRTMYI